MEQAASISTKCPCNISLFFLSLNIVISVRVSDRGLANWNTPEQCQREKWTFTGINNTFYLIWEKLTSLSRLGNVSDLVKEWMKGNIPILTFGIAARICCLTSQTRSSLENWRHFSAFRSGILTWIRTRSVSLSATMTPSSMLSRLVSVLLVILNKCC